MKKIYFVELRNHRCKNTELHKFETEQEADAFIEQAECDMNVYCKLYEGIEKKKFYEENE